MGRNGVAMCTALWYCNGLDGVTDWQEWPSGEQNVTTLVEKWQARGLIMLGVNEHEAICWILIGTEG
jgi:hypothetical protein